jgi:hypothetical protein
MFMSSNELNVVCGMLDRANEKLKGRRLSSEEFKQLDLYIRAIHTSAILAAHKEKGR